MSTNEKISEQYVVISDLQEEIEKFDLANSDYHHFNNGIDLASSFQEELETYQKLLELKEDGIQ